MRETSRNRLIFVSDFNQCPGALPSRFDMTRPTISYHVTRKINLGNFETVSVSVGLDFTVPPDVAPSICYKSVKDWVDERVRTETKRWKDIANP